MTIEVIPAIVLKNTGGEIIKIAFSQDPMIARIVVEHCNRNIDDDKLANLLKSVSDLNIQKKSTNLDAFLEKMTDAFNSLRSMVNTAMTYSQPSDIKYSEIKYAVCGIVRDMRHSVNLFFSKKAFKRGVNFMYFLGDDHRREMLEDLECSPLPEEETWVDEAFSSMRDSLGRTHR